MAATNGGFWLREPFGEPNGFFARDGRLVSDAETQGAGPRGTVGWTADGGIVLDRVDSVESMLLPDGRTAFLDGINRGHREYDEYAADGSDSLLAYTSDYGGPASLAQPRQPDTGRPRRPGRPGRRPAVGAAVAGHRHDPGHRDRHQPGHARARSPRRSARSSCWAPAVPQCCWTTCGRATPSIVGTEIRALDPARSPAWTAVVRGLAGGPMIVKDGRHDRPRATG